MGVPIYRRFHSLNYIFISILYLYFNSLSSDIIKISGHYSFWVTKEGLFFLLNPLITAWLLCFWCVYAEWVSVALALTSALQAALEVGPALEVVVEGLAWTRGAHPCSVAVQVIGGAHVALQTQPRRMRFHHLTHVMYTKHLNCKSFVQILNNSHWQALKVLFIPLLQITDV